MYDNASISDQTIGPLVSRPLTAYDPENYRGVFDQPIFNTPEQEAVVEDKKTQKNLFALGIVASILIKVLL